jgi:hypothetical protein
MPPSGKLYSGVCADELCRSLPTFLLVFWFPDNDYDSSCLIITPLVLNHPCFPLLHQMPMIPQ